MIGRQRPFQLAVGTRRRSLTGVRPGVVVPAAHGGRTHGVSRRRTPANGSSDGDVDRGPLTLRDQMLRLLFRRRYRHPIGCVAHVDPVTPLRAHLFSGGDSRSTSSPRNRATFAHPNVDPWVAPWAAQARAAGRFSATSPASRSARKAANLNYGRTRRTVVDAPESDARLAPSCRRATRSGRSEEGGSGLTLGRGFPRLGLKSGEVTTPAKPGHSTRTAGERWVSTGVIAGPMTAGTTRVRTSRRLSCGKARPSPATRDLLSPVRRAA